MGLDDVIRKWLLHAYGREEALLLLLVQIKLRKYKLVFKSVLTYCILYIIVYNIYTIVIIY